LLEKHAETLELIHHLIIPSVEEIPEQAQELFLHLREPRQNSVNAIPSTLQPLSIQELNSKRGSNGNPTMNRRERNLSPFFETYLFKRISILKRIHLAYLRQKVRDKVSRTNNITY
jgi:hypothetical protein